MLNSVDVLNDEIRVVLDVIRVITCLFVNVWVGLPYR